MGSWYYVHGNIDFTNNNFIYWYDTWYKLAGGGLDTSYTGMGLDYTNNWCYFTTGIEDKNYTGMADNAYGWWYYINGQIDFVHTGFEHNDYGWWYYINGNIDFTNNNYIYWYDTWYKLHGGCVDTEFTGIGEWFTNNYAYFIEGAEAKNYTGYGFYGEKYWHYEDGKVDYSVYGIRDIDVGRVYFRGDQGGTLFSGVLSDDDGHHFYSRGEYLYDDDFCDTIPYDETYKTIACWGDSMTQGVGSYDGFLQYQNKNISYQSYVDHLRTFTGYQTVEHGFGGQTSAQIVDEQREYYGSAIIGNEIQIIEIGSNGGWHGNYDELIDQYKEMICEANAAYYIIVGDTDDPGTSIGDDNEETGEEGDGFFTTGWEDALEEAFGAHFFNLREFMYDNGMDIAELDMTEQDAEEMDKGNLPPSLRWDWTHFNANGYYAKAVGIYRKGIELGYWQ